MHILASFVFFSLFGDLLAAPTWTTMTSSIHARHARLSPSRRDILNLSSSNSDLHDPIIVSAAVAPNAKQHDTPISLPKELYGEFFDDLESWGVKECNKEKPLPPVQKVLLQDVTTSSSASESPAPTKTFTRPDHLPHMGPGLELAPSVSPSNKSIRASSPSLRKLLAVVTVFGVIGLVILFCLLVNEPRILLWRCCKARKNSSLELVRTKRKLIMTEKDRSAWTSKYLSSLSPWPKYLSPPSSSPNDMSPELSASLDGQRPSTLIPDGALDISSDLQKSKWSITTSDYGVSPRTSASTAGGQRSMGPDSAQLVPPSVFVSSPWVNDPLASGSERNSDGSDYPFLCRYGHSRNQSAPVTLSIASSGSEWNVEGRSRSSSESSWKVPRVQWR
ncbi:hypothetical protein M378DRAFT_164828 [Amanita muscaria Koide BX008]|uniref:Uncharacterized protein n=1 Tax=Amanita muscaria (strain Koide BX008) TaxID=946122 RepID=A0A0C2X342_AMAMK|nr:hypothetical protein M378DRAFT_164828 [Amanita muscaria Koide BX008]